MNLVKLLQRPDPSASPDGLESLLLTIGRYGEPKLSRIGGEWYCRVEMNTVVAGTRFEAASGFHHTTATAAAQECLERAEAAIRAVGGSVHK
jgi:hypothetical protein